MMFEQLGRCFNCNGMKFGVWTVMGVFLCKYCIQKEMDRIKEMSDNEDKTTVAKS